MSESQMIIALPTRGEAVLKLPAPLSHELLDELEYAVLPALRQWHHRLGDTQPSPGAIEYASWVLASRF